MMKHLLKLLKVTQIDKLVISTPLQYTSFLCFMYDQLSLILIFNPDYVSEEYIHVYTQYISWPVGYRNIIQQTGLIIQFAYCMLNILLPFVNE